MKPSVSPTPTDTKVARPDKGGDLYVCIADGEGCHETRVVHGYAGVASFYEEMCGRDADGTLASLERTWNDPDEWRNARTMLELKLYCATFSVWAVSAAELERSGLTFVQRSETKAHDLLVKLRKLNIIFPSMCANNGEAYRFLSDLKEYLGEKVE